MAKLKYKDEEGNFVEIKTGVAPEDLTPLEKVENKVVSFSATPSDTKYPSEKLVKDSLDELQDNIDDIESSKWEADSSSSLLYNGYCLGIDITSSTSWRVANDNDWNFLLGGGVQYIKDNYDFNIVKTGIIQSDGSYSNADKSIYLIGDSIPSYLRAKSLSNNTIRSLSLIDNKYGAAIRLVKASTTLLDGEEGTYVGNNGIEYKTVCVDRAEWLAEDLRETKDRSGADISFGIMFLTNFLSLLPMPYSSRFTRLPIPYNCLYICDLAIAIVVKLRQAQKPEKGIIYYSFGLSSIGFCLANIMFKLP